MEGIDAGEWGQLENPSFPFSSYAYLHALEASQSVGERTGWLPAHLTLTRGNKLEGASFLYEKSNSYGEYIFDWAWADAYHRHQVPYFPKLVSAVPFTPATGPKLLAASADVARRLIRAGLVEMETRRCSSLHYLFIAPEEIAHFEEQGFLIRHSFQYHWRNRNYRSFDDFLAALKRRKRKQISREREQLDPGIGVRVLTGEALLPEHAEIFYSFYSSTIQKMGAIPYLTPDFFARVFSSMRDEVYFFIAEERGRPVAGSLCYRRGENLYGRYWGSTKDVRHLHFELCYYRPLELAIEKGLKLFEAGAQGEHKVARGFLPELTYSAHFVRHPAFRDAIARFIEEEKVGIQGLFDEIRDHDPYLEKPGGP